MNIEELAKKIVNEWDFDCAAVFSKLDAIAKREMLIQEFAEALERVQNEALEARIEFPSHETYSDACKRFSDFWISSANKSPRPKWGNFLDAGEYCFRRGYQWLRDNVKYIRHEPLSDEELDKLANEFDHLHAECGEDGASYKVGYRDAEKRLLGEKK